MKSVVYGVMFILLVLCPFFPGQTASEEVVHSLMFSRSELKFEKFNDYDIVRIPNCDITREIGEPQLPVRLVLIAVPSGMKVSGVEFLFSRHRSWENRGAQPERLNLLLR
jgi:hypothetical protein